MRKSWVCTHVSRLAVSNLHNDGRISRYLKAKNMVLVSSYSLNLQNWSTLLHSLPLLRMLQECLSHLPGYPVVGPPSNHFTQGRCYSSWSKLKQKAKAQTENHCGICHELLQKRKKSGLVVNSACHFIFRVLNMLLGQIFWWRLVMDLIHCSYTWFSNALSVPNKCRVEYIYLYADAS